MSLIMVNGYGVVEGKLCFPRVGVWHADLVVDAQDASLFQGRLTVNVGFDALILSGTAKRIDSWVDTVFIRMAAGAANLSKPATPKFYSLPPLQIPLNDLLSGAGESLSPTSDASVLSAQVSNWMTTSAPTSYGIQNLLARGAPNASWRMLADGSLWVGNETWPKVTLDYQVTKRSPHESQIELGLEAPTLLSGVTLDGMRLSYVEHHVTADSVRATAWLE